jgi:hypothetical protein
LLSGGSSQLSFLSGFVSSRISVVVVVVLELFQRIGQNQMRNKAAHANRIFIIKIQRRIRAAIQGVHAHINAAIIAVRLLRAIQMNQIKIFANGMFAFFHKYGIDNPDMNKLQFHLMLDEFF